MVAEAVSGLAAAVGSMAGGMSWAVRGRSSAVFGASVWRARSETKTIALTFDDGPSAATPEILKILAQYGVSATFFQCGVNVLRAPELSLATRGAGHEIGNHSHTHPNFALKRPSFIADEFARAQDAIAACTGVAPSLMRAPYGVRWFGFRAMQERLGLRGVMWTVIGRDWKLPAPAIANRILSHVTRGAIVCLHDGRGTLKDPDARNTIEAVRRIVPSLLENGYHFETVSRLL
jgi:peptidoglycan/xylan/chitin deacetylase (PgdA/CDA1 family)